MDTLEHIRQLEGRIDQIESRLTDLDLWFSLAAPGPESPPTERQRTEVLAAVARRRAAATAHADEVAPGRDAAVPPAIESREDFDGSGFAFTAERALKWAGVTLVFLAVAFAMGVAMERGWLTPHVRVAGGIATALGLIGAGLAIHEGRRLYAQTLEGAGLAIGFLTFFAGHQVLDVLPYAVSFAGMVTTTTAAFALSIRQQQSALAVVGLLGGLATPIVLNIDAGASGTGDGSIVGLAVYITVLTLASAAIYFREGWGSLLAATGLLSASAMAIAVGQLGSTPPLGDQLAAQFMIVAVALGLWATSTARIVLGLPVRARQHVALFDEVFSNVEYRFASAVPIAASLGSYPIWEVSRDHWGWITVVVGLGVSVVAYLLWAGSRTLAISHIGSAAVLLVIGAALIFEGPALMLVLTIQAATLLIVAERLDDGVTRVLAGIVGGIALILFLRDLDETIGSPSAIPWQTALFHALAIGVAFVAAAAARHEKVRMWLGLAAHGATLAWFVEALQHLDQAQAVISAAWASVGLLTIGLAVWLRQENVFKLGLATLALVVTKLILVDMSAVDTIWRVAVFFVTGAALLGIGYRMPQLWHALTAPGGSRPPDQTNTR